MNNLLLWAGRLAGAGGLTVCAVAMGARISGRYFLGNFQLGTLFQAGTAGMVAGCLCLLLVLTTRRQSDR